MTLKNNIFDDDILSIVWKFINLDNMNKASLISKKFFNIYKKLTINDKINIIYNETNSISLFVYKITTNLFNKFDYKKSKFIPKLVKYLNNNLSIKFIENKNLYLIYDFIEIILHTINNKFKNLISKLENINYDFSNKKYSIQFIVNLLGKNKSNTFENINEIFSHYSFDKIRSIRFISFIFLFKLSSNLENISEFDNYRIVISQKKILSINYLKNESITIKNLYPKYLVSYLNTFLLK